MRFLSLIEVISLHRQIISLSGSDATIRDLGMLQSALAQPMMTFDGTDLYPDLVDKAAALGFSLIMNHPFGDGNKRIGHAAMETFLVLNGMEIDASTDEQERIILSLAASQLSREDFVLWLRSHTRKM
jgi:death-on-curing protein